MAVKRYVLPWADGNSTLVYYWCSTEAELPITANPGDYAYSADTLKSWVWNSAWDESGGASGGTAWGDITGTLANQADLETALDGKEAANANIQAHIAAAHAPSDAQKNSDITKAEIEAKLTGQISSHTHAGGSDAFPVGSVFIAVVSTNPATLLGYGTWSAFATGRVLVGIDAGQTEFDTVLETGGTKTHTLTEAEIPAHVHGELAPSSASGGALRFAVDSNANGSVASGLNTASAGGGGAHNNLQPYIVVHMWERVS